MKSTVLTSLAVCLLLCAPLIGAQWFEDTYNDTAATGMPSIVAPDPEAPGCAVLPGPLSKEQYCEDNCVVEALSGDSVDDLPESCSIECPDYILPDEALEPNAICENCPDETCEECYCDTGECIEVPDYGDDYDVAYGSPVRAFVCSSCRPRRSCKQMWWC